jgi:iron complex outermembrane recepter protein
MTTRSIEPTLRRTVDTTVTQPITSVHATVAPPPSRRWARGASGSLAAAIAACSALLAEPLSASTAAPIEEVVVTGSRITRSNATASQPLSTISGEEINRSGIPDMGEVLNDNPALLKSITGTNSIDFEPNNVGQADNIGGGALDLRGLGFQRTLTLVNGRRHVAGVEGTSSVDVSTIPSALVERVEVLTGGTSAIYGADAVTGVVNFILKDDFEGMEVDFSPGISSNNDAESTSTSFIFGRNFDDERGNVVFSAQHTYQAGLRSGDRRYLANDGLYDNDNNPALRFQTGDIGGADTPNFSQFYNFDNTGRFPVGARIPTAASFTSSFTNAFGSAPNLTPTELALIERAATAPPQVFLPGRTFNITSPYGVVAIGDFGIGKTPLGSEPDLDGNGTPDCLDSFTGYNSSLAGTSSFGAAGGCWFIDADGSLVPYRDGLVAGNFNHFGAEQSFIAPNRPFVIPEDTSYAINLNGSYELTEAIEGFFETKYVYQEIDFNGEGHNFTDLLYGAPDNPYLPEALLPYADNDGVGFVGPGGLYISRDSDDWGDNTSTNERTTYRAVVGLRGDLEDLAMRWELSGNYGRFERELKDREQMIADRFFAAIDAATDPSTGEAVCRSDLDPTAYPRTTPFDIPSYVGGGTPSSFFTFRPGDGQCRPANIWGGQGAISQEAIDFFTYSRSVEDEITQKVVTGFLAGDSSAFFELPAGPIGFAIGGEWRDEESAQTYDQYDRGIIQVDGVTWDGTPFAAGDFVGDVSDAASLGGTPSVTLLSGSAGYDVFDVFAEISIPILADKPFARELTLDAAWRQADYSTFGNNTTYNVGGVWSPVDDVRFRASYSEAVRVPNIFELYSPEQGAFFRPKDACDVSQIGLSADPQNRQANCVAALTAINVPNANIFAPDGSYAFEDPLSAGFPGAVGGNEDLQPETATTHTYGVVLQPSFHEWLTGLTLSFDYWEIEIEDAIASVSAQNIVDSCYDSASLDNVFCGLLQRNADATSAQSGGLTYLRQVQLNFGAAEAEGWDATAGYSFDLADWIVNLNATLTRQMKLNLIEPTVPGQPNKVDDELGEMRRPEWSSLGSISLLRGPFSFTWQTQYLSEQVLGYEDGGEIETVKQNFGRAGFADEIYLHSVRMSFEYSDAMTLYGGVDNVTAEDPFKTERAYPVSPRGRYFFAGVSYRLQ